MRPSVTVPKKYIDALEAMGVRFHFRVFEPAACVPDMPGLLLGSLGWMPRGVEFYATWPRHPDPRYAQILHLRAAHGDGERDR
jgi:hypothetical protein